MRKLLIDYDIVENTEISFREIKPNNHLTASGRQFVVEKWFTLNKKNFGDLIH